MLSVQNLTKSFQANFYNSPVTVLKNLSFEVHAGKTTGFVGVNGAGKTTTLKCVLGFVRPENGKALFFGQNELNAEVKQRIGYLPERPYYYDFLTAFEFLKFHWDLAGGGLGFQARAEEVLEKVNLPSVKEKRLRSFSKGMLQRIGIAQAILKKPDFLILDEPMSGLDPDGRIIIKDIILEQKKNGTTIFFSSHLLGDMDELCDNLVVIHSGELVYQGEVEKFSRGQGVEKSFKEVRNQLGEKS